MEIRKQDLETIRSALLIGRTRAELRHKELKDAGSIAEFFARQDLISIEEAYQIATDLLDNDKRKKS